MIIVALITNVLIVVKVIVAMVTDVMSFFLLFHSFMDSMGPIGFETCQLFIKIEQ